MAFRCIKLIKLLSYTSAIRRNLNTKTVTLPLDRKLQKPKEYKTEDNLTYLEDPDNFGTLSRAIYTQNEKLEDEDDIKEEEFIQNIPLASQKLTTKQYADLIKQYLKFKRIKEAIDVLEVRMLKEDRVKPENYIYNILIGACADVGYTKKAFKLFNDMKRRALKPTGDTYTCLFEACVNSPWVLDGLKNARHLRELMVEKGIEPNLTNYNAMIKAFGRCGDLPMAFRIVDEMRSKKIKIRVHTFNHLLHACISDKGHGLRHALIVWRKMLQMREKPNIYSFNLILKCVRDCNLGSRQDIEELLGTIQEQISLASNRDAKMISSSTESPQNNSQVLIGSPDSEITDQQNVVKVNHEKSHNNDVCVVGNDNVPLEFVNKVDKVPTGERLVPNLLSRVVNMHQVTSLQEINTPQDKFSVIGGQDDFLKEMDMYSLTPDIKVFTQMLPLIENTTDAEDKLLEAMKSYEIKADIDFYNMLIKKRSLRKDYKAAIAVKQIIKKENEYRKKRYPSSKKLKLNVNIMTYGVLALACKTKENAEELLNEMEEKQLKVNIEILGTLLRNGTANFQFGYVFHIMNLVKQEKIRVNQVFLKHLEDFNDKCLGILKLKNGRGKDFHKSCEIFVMQYSSWLKDINIDEALKPEHPWEQFKQNYPETLQRQNVEIKQPKKYYKKDRRSVPYTPKIVG